MIPHDEHLENELRRLNPRAPSPQLKQRIAERLNADRRETVPARGKVMAFPVVWVRAAAAALLLSLIGIPLFRIWKAEPGTGILTGSAPAVKTVPAGMYQPVLTKRTLVNREDEGIVSVNGYGPLRKVRYQTLNHMEWENQKTGRKFAITAPQENIVFVKLNSY